MTDNHPETAPDDDLDTDAELDTDADPETLNPRDQRGEPGRDEVAEASAATDTDPDSDPDNMNPRTEL